MCPATPDPELPTHTLLMTAIPPPEAGACLFNSQGLIPITEVFDPLGEVTQ